MPYYMLHSIYYDYWLYVQEQAKKSDEQRGAEAFQQAIEDNM